MPRASKSKLDREATIAEVALLARRGYTQDQIAARVKCSQSQVSILLKEIRQRYVDRTEEATAAQINEQVETYRDIMREAWEAFERSKADVHKTEELTEQGQASMRGGFQKTARRRIVEQRLPSHEYLTIVMNCLREIAKLKGYYAPDKLTLNGTLVNIPWDVVASGAVPMDEVEAEIVDMEARSLPAPDGGTN